MSPLELRHIIILEHRKTFKYEVSFGTVLVAHPHSDTE